MLELTLEGGIDLTRSGARHGRGLFETLRIQNGRPRFLEHHWARLEKGCTHLGLEAPPEPARIEAFLEAHGIGAGAALAGLRLLAVDGRLIVWAEPGPEPPSQPVWLGLSRQTTRFTGNPLNAFKTLSYLENLQMSREAAGRGLFEVIAPNEQGRLSDGSRTTLFLVQDGRVLTPPLADGALPGVGRRVLLEARVAEEAPLSPESLKRAEAVFLANALRGVIPVGGLEDCGPRPTDHPLIAAAAACL